MSDLLMVVYCDDAEHSDPFEPVWSGAGQPADELPADVVILAEFDRDPETGWWRAAPFSARWGGKFRNPHKNTVQYVAADGSIVALSGMDVSRQVDQLRRAHALAGGGDTWNLGLRYQMRCPVCEHHSVRRTGTKMSTQFDLVAAQGFTGVSLAFLNLMSTPRV